MRSTFMFVLLRFPVTIRLVTVPYLIALNWKPRQSIKVCILLLKKKDSQVRIRMLIFVHNPDIRDQNTSKN